MKKSLIRPSTRSMAEARAKARAKAKAKSKANAFRKCNRCGDVIPAEPYRTKCQACSDEMPKIGRKYRRVEPRKCGGCSHVIMLEPCVICDARKGDDDAANQG